MRVRRGDDGDVHPNAASPGVKLLTDSTGVRTQVHQGNETPGLYYGPRCIVGRTQGKVLVEMDYRQRVEVLELGFIFFFTICGVLFSLLGKIAQ